MLERATSQSKTFSLESNKFRLLSYEHDTTRGPLVRSLKCKSTVYPLFYIMPYATDVVTAPRLCLPNRGSYCKLPLIYHLKTKARNKHPKVFRAMNVTTTI